MGSLGQFVVKWRLLPSSIKAMRLGLGSVKEEMKGNRVFILIPGRSSMCII